MAGKQAASVLIGMELDSASFETSAQRARRAMSETLGGIRADSARSAQSLTQLTAAAQGIAGLAGFALGARGALDLGNAIVQAGDQAVQLRAKLEASVGNGAQAFQEARTAADALGVSTDTVAGTVARLGFALQGTGTSRQQILQLTETMARLGAVGGASSQSISQGLQQLSQGLAKGRLDGDELRSVLENIPGSGRLIAEAMGVAQGALRDLGAEGKITRDVVLEAFSDANGQIKAQFESLPPSLGRVTATMLNQFQDLFAAVDRSLGSSSFVKYLAGNLGDVASSLAARANVASPTGGSPEAQELVKNREELGQLQVGLNNARQGGPAGLEAVAGLEARIGELVKRQNELRDAINGATTARERQIEVEDHATARGQPGQVFDYGEIKRSGDTGAQALYPDQSADPAAYKKSRDTFIKPLQQDIAQEDQRAATARDQAAKSAATLRGEQEKILANAKQEAAAAQMIAEAGGQSVTARQRAVEQAESERRILEASYRLSKDQLEVFKQSEQARLEGQDRGRTQEAARGQTNADIDDFASSLKSRGAEDLRDSDQLRSRDTQYSQDIQKSYWEESQSQYDKYLEGINDKARGNQDIMQDILAQPWRNLAGEINSIMGGVFSDILSDAKGLDLSSIPQGLAQSANKAASGALAGVATMPFTSAVAAIGSGKYDSPMDFARQNPTLAAGGLGYLGGSLGGQALGFQGQYSGLGGGLGASLGMMIPGAGPFGAIAGGLAGTFLGGTLGNLFGGSDDPNDRSQQQYNSAAGRITYSDKSFGAQNRSITSGILGEVGQLQKALEGLGSTVGAVALNVQSGTKTGLQVNGQRFGGQEDATAYALKQLLASATNLTGSQQTVLANTKGTSAQAIAQDLGLAKAFDDLTFSGKDVERAVRDINATFDTAVLQMGRLGLSTDALNAARDREIEKAQETQRRADRNLGATFQAAIAGSDPLRVQLIGINSQFAQLTDTLKDAGYSSEQLAQVDAERRREEAAASDQYWRQRQDLDSTIRQTTGPTDLYRAQQATNQRFDQLIRSMNDAGGYAQRDFNDVNEARNREQRQLVQQQQRTDRDTRSQFFSTVDSSKLGRAITGANSEFDQLIDRFQDAGIAARDLTRVEEARTKAVEDLIKAQVKEVQQNQRQIDSQVRSFRDYFDNLIDPIRAAANDNRTLNPLTQVNQALAKFREDASGAGSGDTRSLQNLSGSASTLRGLVDSNLSTGGYGANIRREIADTLNSVAGDLEKQRNDALATVPDVLRETTDNVIKAMREGIAELVAANSDLRTELKRVGRTA